MKFDLNATLIAPHAGENGRPFLGLMQKLQDYSEQKDEWDAMFRIEEMCKIYFSGRVLRE